MFNFNRHRRKMTYKCDIQRISKNTCNNLVPISAATDKQKGLAQKLLHFTQVH